MLAWVAAAAFICATCAVLGYGFLFTLTVSGQNIAFLIMALSALVFVGAFDAYEASPAKSTRDQPDEGDASSSSRNHLDDA